MRGSRCSGGWLPFVVGLLAQLPFGEGALAQSRAGSSASGTAAASSPAAPASGPAGPTTAPPADLDALAARFDHEPTVAEVVRDALAYHAEGLADPTRAARRSRRSAWLPELRLRARRGRQRDANATQSGTNLSTDDDAIVEGALVFDLPRTVYSGEEATWSREARAQAAARTQLVRLVVSLYFERRRLQLERELGARDLPTLVRLVEIEAILDGLTGGRFGEQLRAAEAAAADP